MNTFLVAILRLFVSTQIAILNHLIYLHKVVSSKQSDYLVLYTNIRVLNEVAEVLEQDQDVPNI